MHQRKNYDLLHLGNRNMKNYGKIVIVTILKELKINMK